MNGCGTIADTVGVYGVVEITELELLEAAMTKVAHTYGGNGALRGVGDFVDDTLEEAVCRVVCAKSTMLA